MRRRKTKSSVMFYSAMIVCSMVAFVAGYYTYQKINKDGGLSKLDYENSLPEQNYTYEMRVDSNEEKNSQLVEEEHQAVAGHTVNIEETTKIIFRKKYTICNSIVEEIQFMSAWVGLNEEKLEEKISNSHPCWEIAKFSFEEVVLYSEVKHVQPNHYYVTEENGYIIVYGYDETSGKTLAGKTKIPITILPQVDQDLIKQGILLKDKHEVMQLLEDYSS